MTPFSIVLILINILLLSINEGDARGQSRLEGCEAGWSVFNGKCYKYFSEKKTWAEAEDQCVTNEAHLVSLHSAEEYQFIKAFNGDSPWVGGQRDQGNNWYWSDGTPWDYSNWASGAPHAVNFGLEDCAHFWLSYYDGKMNDKPCNYVTTFVCKKSDPNIDIIERGRLIDTVDLWGPLFRISFDLLISSFGPSEWGSILSFKGNGGTNNCCNNGDRVPMVQLRDNGQLYFINSINGKGNTYFHTAVDLHIWHKIKIEQMRNWRDDKVYFSVEIDGEEVERLENNDPRSFENVKIYAGDNFYDPANGRYKNLQYEHIYDFVPIGK